MAHIRPGSRDGRECYQCAATDVSYVITGLHKGRMYFCEKCAPELRTRQLEQLSVERAEYRLKDWESTHPKPPELPPEPTTDPGRWTPDDLDYPNFKIEMS